MLHYNTRERTIRDLKITQSVLNGNTYKETAAIFGLSDLYISRLFARVIMRMHRRRYRYSVGNISYNDSVRTLRKNEKLKLSINVLIDKYQRYKQILF